MWGLLFIKIRYYYGVVQTMLKFEFQMEKLQFGFVGNFLLRLFVCLVLLNLHVDMNICLYADWLIWRNLKERVYNYLFLLIHKTPNIGNRMKPRILVIILNKDSLAAWWHSLQLICYSFINFVISSLLIYLLIYMIFFLPI